MSNIHQVILKAHQEIHEGQSFKTDVNEVALGAASTLSIYIKTPDTAARIHCIYEAYASLSAIFEVLEAPTVTPGTGAALVIFNRDRNSATTSVVFDNGGVPAQNSATKDVTVTVAGTQIHHELFSGKKAAGDTRDEREFILKQNTAYVYRITSNAANNIIQLTLSWYEEGI